MICTKCEMQHSGKHQCAPRAIRVGDKVRMKGEALSYYSRQRRIAKNHIFTVTRIVNTGNYPIALTNDSRTDNEEYVAAFSELVLVEQ